MAHSLPLRVDRYLRDATGLALNVVRSDAFWAKVTVVPKDGVPLRSPARDELVFEGDTVEFDAAPLARRVEHEYLALNKPLGVTSSARDPDGLADLSKWLRHLPRGPFPIGRLDRMTSGLLLLTTDGDLANAVLHPLHHVEKVYSLVLRGCTPASDPRLARLLEGVTVPGETQPLRATRVDWLHSDGERTSLRVALSEGKYHQIRKMCRVSGLGLERLHRQSVGGIELGELGLGEIRSLSHVEVERLWAAAGGRELVEARQLLALERRAIAARHANTPLHRLEQWLVARGRPIV